MKRFSLLLPVLLSVFLPAACRKEREPETARVGAGVVVTEIAATTSSEKALEHFATGLEALDVGAFRKANESFRKAVREDQTFAHAYLNIAFSATSTEEFKENVDRAAENAAAASEGERLLIEIGKTFLDNNLERRLELASELVKEYTASPRALVTLALAQGALNDHDAARLSLSRALSLDPTSVFAHRILATSYVFNEPKDLVQAEEHARKVVELRLEEPAAHILLGDVFRAQGLLAKARDAYGRAAELDPTHVIALEKKGHAETFLGQYEQARASFGQAREAADDQRKVISANWAAFTHAYAGDGRLAVKALEDLYGAIDGMNIPAHQVRGAKIFTLTSQVYIALHAGQLNVAEQALARRAALTREDAEVVGTPEFKRSTEADIAFWDGVLAARKGDFKTALAKAEENARLVEQEKNPRKLEPYHGLMGLIQLLQKNYAEAVRHYQQADPNSIYVKYHLALSQEGTGNREEARRLLQEVADFNFNAGSYAAVRSDAVRRLEGKS